MVDDKHFVFAAINSAWPTAAATTTRATALVFEGALRARDLLPMKRRQGKTGQAYTRYGYASAAAAICAGQPTDVILVVLHVTPIIFHRRRDTQ